MDISDILNQIISRLPSQLPHIQTEEATKNALVLPLLNGLGYNVFDPTEVVPEFVADVGTKKGEKVDYVIMREGRPTILIECKTVGATLHINHASQLFRYFAVTDARFAILTNGIDYKFFTDIEAPNKMDEKPFFEFSLQNLDKTSVSELRKFAKANFDLENILSTASALKYKKQIQSLINRELESPSEDFVKHFTKQVYGGILTAAVKSQFTELVGDAFREFIRNSVNTRLQSALAETGGEASALILGPTVAMSPPSQSTENSGASNSEVITTDEEREAFQIVRAILAKYVKPSRIVMRDTQSYCGVLLDDNNRRPICRLRFNYSQKYLGLLDENRDEQKIPLQETEDLFLHEEALVAAWRRVDPTVANASKEAPPLHVVPPLENGVA